MTVARLQLYSRPGCHLCDEMLAAAAPVAERHGASIAKVNIDDDPELARRYGRSIPVLMLAGREICRHRLDAAALERELARPAADAGR